MRTILIFLVFIFIVGILTTYVSEREKYNKEIIKVSITLENNCELIDDAFMVVSSPIEKIGKFANGKIEMFLPRSSKVQLAANNKYEGFHFSSIPVKVSKDLVLEANCANSDRLENIFDSLRNQFNK